jgi:hypothetical protein
VAGDRRRKGREFGELEFRTSPVGVRWDVQVGPCLADYLSLSDLSSGGSGSSTRFVFGWRISVVTTRLVVEAPHSRERMLRRFV